MDLFEELNREKKLTASLISKFEAKFGALFFKALQFLQKEGPKVTQTTFNPSKLVIWTVQGQNKRYVVYPDLYCQCQSFLLNSIYRKRNYYPCKHLLAQKLAIILDQYQVDTLSDLEWNEWKNQF